ncbi:hypothetical protein MBCUT_16340 [Methanobrevibacter cuticularis]|uniref:DUF11 domain-containing protein n=2 Tax=Methanobrevibacter cuticularis TaxID=47311 RepID=A0A166D400_9EURY|nr:hypothetical protein MBCUT_16340 [Methanobrevibacter cuticularis]
MFLLVLFIAIGTLTTSSVSAADKQVTVGMTSAQIQAILDSAEAGDIIHVAAGVYNDIALTINKAVTILGHGATFTGSSTNNTPIFALVSGNDTSLYKDISISNLVLEAMTAITVRGGSNITLENLTLIGVSENNGTGIDARNGVNGLTINNVDASGFRDAVGVGGGNNTLINNSYFHDLGRNGMSFFQNSGNIKVTNNNITNSQFGIYFGGGVQDIIIDGNNITNISNVAIALVKAANSATIINNAIDGNAIGIIIKAGDTSHGAPSQVNDIIILNNSIQNNALIGILLENLPESKVGKEVIIGDDNVFGGNGYGYRDANGWDPSEWTTAIGSSFDIVKNYYEEDSPVLKSNVSISNTINKQVVKNGEKTVYTITVKNTGNGSSDKITVGTGVSSSYANVAVQYKASESSYANNQWTINSLGAGDTAVLVLELTTKKSGSTNIISSLKTDNTTINTNSQKLTINKDIKLSYSNKLASSKIKKGKSTTLSTTIKNSGKDKSNKVSVKITLPKGVKVAATNYKAQFNKKTGQWTIEVPAGKTIKLSMKISGTAKGTKNIVFNVNGKTQAKKLVVV